jgi:hypothetical protein
MSTRWIAGIGLVLCAAMTTFSIYLGAVEHVYRPKPPRVHALNSVPPRDLSCQVVHFRPTTTTTHGGSLPRSTSCVGDVVH